MEREEEDVVVVVLEVQDLLFLFLDAMVVVGTVCLLRRRKWNP